MKATRHEMHKSTLGLKHLKQVRDKKRKSIKKRFFFSDDAFSLLIGHLRLKKLRQHKRDLQKRMKGLIVDSKNNMLK